MEYSRIFHLHNEVQHYGVRKRGSARGKLSTICRVLEDLPRYGRRGIKPVSNWGKTILRVLLSRPLGIVNLSVNLSRERRNLIFLVELHLNRVAKMCSA